MCHLHLEAVAVNHIMRSNISLYKRNRPLLGFKNKTNPSEREPVFGDVHESRLKDSEQNIKNEHFIYDYIYLSNYI